MKWNVRNRSALFSKSENNVLEIGTDDINLISELSQDRHEIVDRLCIHKASEDPLHQMIITHKKRKYIQPHRVNRVGEGSYLVLEGKLDLIVFSDSGTPEKRIRMTGYGKKGTFFCRLPSATFRTQILWEDSLFVETRLGPFRYSEKEIAHWAPNGKNCILNEQYVRSLIEKLESS